jgi:hypothetical protein
MSTHFAVKENPGLIAYVGTVEQFPVSQHKLDFVGRVWNRGNSEFNINDNYTVEIVVRDAQGSVVNKRLQPPVDEAEVSFFSEGASVLSPSSDDGIGSSLTLSALGISVPGVYQYEVTVWITSRKVEGRYESYGIPAGKGTFWIGLAGAPLSSEHVRSAMAGKIEEASKHLNELFQPRVLWRSNADDFDKNGVHWKPIANGQFVPAPTSELLRVHQSIPAPVRSVSTSDPKSSKPVAAEPPSVVPLVLVLLGLLIVGVWIALRLKALMNHKSQ